MDQVIEKRKQFLISALYWTVVAIGLILAGKYVLPCFFRLSTIGKKTPTSIDGR